MMFTQTVSSIAGNQPHNFTDNDYLSFFCPDIRENLPGLFVGEKWENRFDFAVLVTGVEVPHAATIVSAKIWVEGGVANHPESMEPIAADVALLLSYEETDSASKFTTAFDFENRPRSSYQSISKLKGMDVTNFVQEIVNRLGWSSGNNINFFFEHDQVEWQQHFDFYAEDLSLRLIRNDFVLKEFMIEIEWCSSGDTTSHAFPCITIPLNSSGGGQANYLAGNEVTKIFEMPVGNTQMVGYQPNSWDPAAATDIVWYTDNSHQSPFVGVQVLPNNQLSMVALQFRSIDIEQGTSISKALLRIPCENWLPSFALPPESSLDVLVSFEDTDSAENFSTESNFSARSKSLSTISTTLSVTVALEEWEEGKDGPYLVTHYHIALDVTELVQEVVEKPGWVSGNSIVFFIESAAAPGNYFYILFLNPAFYLDLSFNAAEEPPHVEYFLPMKVGLSGSGDGSPGTRVHSFPTASVNLEFLGRIHTSTTMVEPRPYVVELKGAGPIEYEVFNISNISIDFSMAGGIQVFEATASAGDVWVIYLSFLSGDKDGLNEIQIPLKSVQAILRSETMSYLNIVTPAIDLSEEIAARKNGDIRVIMAQVQSGKILRSEEIARAALDYIGVSEGGTNQSITLAGHRAENITPKTITVPYPTYRSTINGKKRIRFPQPNMYLKPGDTVISGDVHLVADQISISISSEHQQMEVAEK